MCEGERERGRERMIDVKKKKETEDLVRGGRKVQMPAIQMSVARAGLLRRSEREKEERETGSK